MTKRKMPKAELISKLNLIGQRQSSMGDPEADHCDADDLLLEFINDPEVKKAYDSINKWYA